MPPRLLLLVLCSCVQLGAADLDDADLDARIDRVRRGDFTVTLRDAAGKPATGAMQYHLARHAFRFGTAVNVAMLPAGEPNADQRRYQELLAGRFNTAVAENAMKWYAMEPKRGQADDEPAERLWRWCHDHGMYVRGHCLLWGVTKYVPGWVKELQGDELRQTVQRRLEHTLGMFRGRIDEWDLNNEMLHDDWFAKALDLKSPAAYFQWAHAIDPSVRLCLNDYEIIGGGKVGAYVKQIKALLAEGAPLGGIGDQAHLTTMPPNEKVWAVLDQLGQFKLPVNITEFDLDTKDEQRQAQDLRRFYRLCFAHPAVASILMWGFWEGSHWRPRAALWRKDWSIKPVGEAYVALMEHDFASDGEATPDADGAIRFRGFFGDYVVTAGDGRTWRATLGRDQPQATATPTPR